MNKILVFIAIAISALCIGAAVGFAAQWYYSLPKQTTVVTWVVTLNDLPPQVTTSETLSLTGQVIHPTESVVGIAVHILKTNSTDTDLDIGAVSTVADGAFTFDYIVIDTTGETLTFKAAINK